MSFGLFEPVAPSELVQAQCNNVSNWFANVKFKYFHTLLLADSRLMWCAIAYNGALHQRMPGERHEDFYAKPCPKRRAAG